MWIWVLAAGLFLLAALLFFLLYRRAKLALEHWDHQANALTVDGVAALLGELEATGEAIVERLEAKQREVEQLIELLDTKLELLQVATILRTEQSTKEEPGDALQTTLATPRADQTEEFETELGEKQQLVLQWQQQGLNAVEIARKTDLKLDEVRLILSLFHAGN